MYFVHLKDTESLSFHEFLGRVVAPNAGPAPDKLILRGGAGPNLGRLYTDWHEFSLDESEPDLIIPSILDEGDKDDAPFPCRSGMIGRVSGSSSAYVFADRKDAPAPRNRWRQGIADFAAWGPTSPVASEESPIHPALLVIRDTLIERSEAAGTQLDVAAYGSGLVIETRHGARIDADLTPNGFDLDTITELYLDESDSDPEEAPATRTERLAEEAKELTKRKMEGLLFEAGWLRPPELTAGTSVEARYDASDVVSWTCTVRTVDALERAALAVDAAETPLIVNSQYIG